MTDNRHYHIHGGKDFLEWLWEQLGGHMPGKSKLDEVLDAVTSLQADVAAVKAELDATKAEEDQTKTQLDAVQKQVDALYNDAFPPRTITATHEEPKPNV